MKAIIIKANRTQNDWQMKLKANAGIGRHGPRSAGMYLA